MTVEQQEKQVGTSMRVTPPGQKKVRSLARSSDEYIRLLSYVMDRPEGYWLPYDRVEKETGVKMNRNGRDKLRRCVLRSGREYVCFPGVGYELDKIETAVKILTGKLQAVGSKIRRAKQAHQRIQVRFFARLGTEEQRMVMMTGSVFLAMDALSEEGKRLYAAKQKEKLGITAGSPMTIPSPEDIQI